MASADQPDGITTAGQQIRVARGFFSNLVQQP
jgi:hypothetical protein